MKGGGGQALWHFAEAKSIAAPDHHRQKHQQSTRCSEQQEHYRRDQNKLPDLTFACLIFVLHID